MEKYELKYKKALKWMQSLYSGLHGKTKEEAEHYFPELKESKDDRIVRCLLNYFHHVRYNGLDLKGTDIDEVIAWLEKQGEKKPTDKVEPKTLDEWLNENVADFWANPCNPNRVINQFKKDFGL